MEMLDIVDDNGEPTGEQVSRDVAHELGIQHRTTHLWLVRRRNENWQLLVQKRSDTKDSNPGCMDISSAGHITAGQTYEESAIRELKEELGVDADASELIYAGIKRIHYEKEFYGKMFRDRQVSKVYIIQKDVEPEDLHLQESEVSAAIWMDLADCIQMVATGQPKNCIDMIEMDFVKAAIDKLANVK